jgi:hypothetical protein
MSEAMNQLSPNPQRRNGAVRTQAAQRIPSLSVTKEAIARRAYEKFAARGYAHGSDQEDWTQAESELAAEAGGE